MRFCYKLDRFYPGFDPELRKLVFYLFRFEKRYSVYYDRIVAL